MTPRTGTRLALLLVLAGSLGMSTVIDVVRDAARMSERAALFLESLSPEQRRRATFAFDSDERSRFHFIPSEMFERRGLPIYDMTPEQRERAHDLLQSGLSQRGYLTATQIMQLEGVLAAIEGDDRRFARDPDAYLLTLFGTPDRDGTWGWRFEGHHLSLHFTVVGGRVTVSAPTFLSTNPAEVLQGPRIGLRVLGTQEDAGRALLASLDDAQRRVAIIDDVAPRDIVTGAALEVEPLSPVGIRADELRAGQRDLLLELVASYASLMSEDIEEARMSAIRDGGVENLTFAWAGGTERGDVSYFRVQGPTFLIEFDNTAQDPNHVHSVWRDFEGDLGRDMLRDHVQDQPH